MQFGKSVPLLIALMTARLLTGTPAREMQLAVLLVKPFGKIIDFMGRTIRSHNGKTTRNDVPFFSQNGALRQNDFIDLAARLWTVCHPGESGSGRRAK